jgi:hypothetical protein
MIRPCQDFETHKIPCLLALAANISDECGLARRGSSVPAVRRALQPRACSDWFPRSTLFVRVPDCQPRRAEKKKENPRRKRPFNIPPRVHVTVSHVNNATAMPSMDCNIRAHQTGRQKVLKQDQTVPPNRRLIVAKLAPGGREKAQSVLGGASAETKAGSAHRTPRQLFPYLFQANLICPCLEGYSSCRCLIAGAHARAVAMSKGRASSPSRA